MGRVGGCERRTEETSITVRLALDGRGRVVSETGLPFFDHMLTAMAFHGRFDLEVCGRGDLEVDPHHLVEDVGICVGRALADALGMHEGIERFGHAVVPMDESLVTAVIDISGRPLLHWDLPVPERRFGAFHTDLLPEFFRALVNNARLTMHLRGETVGNAHHAAEAAFKAVGRALRSAVTRRETMEIPSTKGRVGG
ncbi:MAG: imidazoleglycerol-phosphate dehydratase HisB [Bacillota bacterium]